MKYYISQGIVTEESGESGDFASWDQWEESRLSSALKSLQSTRTSQVDGIESENASFSDYGKRLTVTVNNSMEYLTGEYETRALHIHGISRYSAARLCNILDIRLDNF